MATFFAVLGVTGNEWNPMREFLPRHFELEQSARQYARKWLEGRNYEALAIVCRCEEIAYIEKTESAKFKETDVQKDDSSL